MKPGIYDNIPESVYHADPCETPSLSSSIGKVVLQKSLLHAWEKHPKLNPNFVPDNDTKFDIGTAAHKVCLENDLSSFHVIYYDDYRKNAAKDERDCAFSEGKIPILEKQTAEIYAMSDAFNKFIEETEFHDFRMKSKAEQTLIWDYLGVNMRARLDILFDDNSMIMDYKTTANAHPIDFYNKKIPQLDYDFQADFYVRGVEALTGVKPSFVWIVQETEKPYACSLVGCGNEMIDKAHARVEYVVGQWKEAIASGNWSGYPKKVLWADPVAWAQYRFDDILLMEE